MFIRDARSRSLLSIEQRDFFYKVVPYGRLIQDWTISKAEFMDIPTYAGVKASLIIADILLESGFGTHPLSREQYNNKYSNNLALIKADKYWKGKFHTYGRIKYRAYKDWYDFAANYSDYFVFSGKFLKVFQEVDTGNQLYYISLTKRNEKVYNEEITKLIYNLNLEEFNIV